MAGVKVRENETIDTAMRRFKRVVEKSGVISEYRRREFFESGSEKRKRALAAAIKRFRKKQQREFKSDKDGRGGRGRGGKSSSGSSGSKGRGGNGRH